MKMNQKVAVSISWLAGLALIAGCCCCGAPDPPSNGVQIKVNVNGLSDAEVDDLKAKLAAIAGSDSNNSTVFNGAATWNYTTDDEPQAFADKIDFATVTSVDDRVITLKVSRAPADNPTDDGTADDAATDEATDADATETDATATDATDADATVEVPSDGDVEDQ